MIRRYRDYHRKIISILQNTLDQHSIGFDLLDLQALLARPDRAGSRSAQRPLVIWSEDFLYNGVATDQEQTSVLEVLQRIKDLGPVLWLTAVDHADRDFMPVPDNVKFLHYGSDILFQMMEYPKISPQSNKDLDPARFWISLSHAPRPARVIAACGLLGHDLGDRESPIGGVLRISDSSIQEYQHWKHYLQDHVSDITCDPIQDSVLQLGFQRLKDQRHGGQPCGNIYRGMAALDNAGNFDRNLRELYRHSLIEIVNETTFFNQGIFVTEKFLNSVYGYNLPIVMSTPGTVDYLRTHGFDMFDDVIDHSYDHITDPIQRIFTAIQSNLLLLTDRDHARQCWQQCRSRLDENFHWARDHMYDHFVESFQKDLIAYLDNDLKTSYNVFLQSRSQNGPSDQ